MIGAKIPPFSYTDPNEDFGGGSKRKSRKEKEAKIKNLKAAPTVDDDKEQQFKGKRRRRGGRRYHKRYSAAPRVVILGHQDIATEIRQRADEFVNQRLFGVATANGVKSFRTPKRMTPEEMRQLAAKLKARRLSLRGL